MNETCKWKYVAYDGEWWDFYQTTCGRSIESSLKPDENNPNCKFCGKEAEVENPMNETETAQLEAIISSLAVDTEKFKVRYDVTLLFDLQNDIACRLIEASGRVEGKHNMAREMMVAALKED